MVFQKNVGSAKLFSKLGSNSQEALAGHLGNPGKYKKQRLFGSAQRENSFGVLLY